MSERYMRQAMRWMAMAAILATAVQGRGQSAGKGAETPSQLAPAQPVAQSEPAQDERGFQLTFTARELDENGKVVNARKYDTMTTTESSKWGGTSNIRAGARVPISTGANSFTYLDLGANFDVSRVRIVKGNRLAMQVSAEISSFDATRTEANPTIQQNRWGGDVEVPIGGRKVIFSSDDLSSKKTLQIELAVTPVVER
ncbi:hypothetical protein [Edaphobacter aggregans]|uniref:hypothetical protein n=1 Tax=Edaphobacter aggregans TaxID=570835 RepID=UPI0012FAE34D|nr:hypothetical protein [Edaphobacter aggregans]